MSLTRSEHVNKFKRTLFIRTKYNMRTFGVIPIIKLLIFFLFVVVVILFCFCFVFVVSCCFCRFCFVFDIINSYWCDVL